ncbi:nuclear pore complex protein Nup214 [Bactrocera dorsalis]|uniref:Nuclear pore complex protein Nup214 n=5 Tax=Bactrocera dorsalis TaxID=27457 RepID=A0ABM3JKP6_BACDO|nr:nuclear pore complex protein Nup214 [Bactrocera dorsalis]
MALQCPGSVDVTDIQFKLQSKHKIFGGNSKLRDHVNLLACASNYGLLFVGNPNAPELQAYILPDVIYAKSKGQPVHLRTTKLPNVPNSIACNADGSMLAVNYTLQGYGVLDIYHVPSFATSDVKTLYSIRLPDQNVYALHLLWNPVLSNIIGVVLSNGNFALYTLKDGGAMEMRSLQNQQIQSGCWSPKGKQLVFGYPNGKLQQFKPDLTMVKSIICPPNVHPGPFDTIALHWLSTFQFVASFLQNGEEAMPNMYIINAPKGGTPVYINYNDVCYSGSEPRKQQVTFMHIAQWNLLLVTSANGVEIGLLGTKDANDQPQWVHYMLLDEARIEMPLTEGSDETYPIGLALDISPTHELVVGEKKLHPMPVIHVLSTHGHLLCFNFLNLSTNVNICSPPAPIQYAMAKFTILAESSFTDADAAEKEENENLPVPSIEAPPPPPASTLTFNTQPQLNVANQNLSAFGVPANKNLFSGGFEQKPQNLKFGMAPANAETMPNILNKPTAQAAPLAAPVNTLKPAPPTEVFKPLYTVSPEFAPPPVQPTQQTPGKTKTHTLNLNETNTVIQQMIVMQITAFDKEIKQLAQKSKIALNDDPGIMKSYSKRLINLQEIIEQANERDFIKDVQDLRHSLTESYEMLNECRSKLETFKNPDEPGAKYLSLYDCISQRQLKGLQSYLTINQSIMKRLEEQMDIQWSYYQDLVRRNSKSQMRIPCLDGIYQQMTKLKNLITQEQTKLHYIKNIMKQKDLGNGRTGNDCRKESNQLIKSDVGIVSLADSILSMTIHNITDAKSNKLSESKLNALRNFTNQQAKIKIIKPQRPNRIELTSEVILETKQLIKKKETKDVKTIKVAEDKNVATTKEVQQQAPFSLMQAATKQNIELQVPKPQQQQPEQQSLQFSKPTPTAGYFSNSQSSAQTAAAAQLKQQTSTPFSTVGFGNGNNFLPKAEPLKFESGNEMPKFNANTNAFKTDVIENKTNTVTAHNNNALAKTETADKSSAPAMNFSYTSKGDAADIGKSSLNFNAPSKAFTGFGQQSSNTIPQTNIFNANKTTAVNANANQTNDAPKAFSFGSTFSALTDLNNANKQSAAQNQSNLPANTNATAITQPLFGTTTMLPTIFNKQNESQYFAPPTAPLSAASTIGKEKISTADAQTKSTSLVNALNQDTTERNVVGNVGATQTKSEADDMYLKSLNICKPTPKEAVKPKDGSMFSFSLNTENNPPGAFHSMQPDLSISKVNTIATSTPATAAPTPTIFGKLTTTEQSPSPFSVANTNVTAFGGTLGSTTPSTLSLPTTSSIGGAGASAFSFTNSSLFKQLPTFQSQTLASTTTTTTTTTTAATVTPTSATISALTAAKPAPTEAAAFTKTTTTVPTASLAPTAAITVAAATTILTPTPSPTIVAPTAVSAAPVSGATSPFFSTIAAAKAPGESLFGNLGQPTQAVSPVSSMAKTDNASQPATTTSVSAFGGLSLGSQAPAASGGSIFGNSGSVGFGAATGGIFAAAAAASMPASPAAPGANTSTGSIFGNSAVKSPDSTGGSIFGNAAAKPAENTGSIFGNAAVKSADNAGGSIFGGTPAKNPDNVNVFGSPTSANAAVSSSSIFGQSSGSIFASAAAANKPDSTSTASGFSFVGSAFGAAPNNTAASGGSIFGAAAAASGPQQQQQANIFSSPASGFGATANSPFSSFSQGGSSIASTGFGSPSQQQQAGAFPRPVFGGAPTFGSPPGFGAQPSFGGAPTFGSPKGFGSFATPTTTAFSAPTTQSSNIFDALGSTDTGLSFGNLAQTTNTPPDAPKPIFGGSSFMNYRA